MASWTTTYTGLTSLLGTFVEDSSTEFTDAVQGIVNRGEDRVVRDLDITYFDERRSTSTASGVATIAREAGAVITQSIYFTAANAYAQRRTYDYVKFHGGSGRPLYWYEDDEQITFAPTPDAVYAIIVSFLSQPTPLSASNTTNWLTQNVASLLLNACLIESEKFLIAPERVAEFKAEYAALLTPARATWRAAKAESYEPVAPAPVPAKER